MIGRREASDHIAPAIVLAALTLAVFIASQGRGPQSAIQRFHEALRMGDTAGVEALMLSPSSEDSKVLAGEIQNLYRSSRSVQYGRIQTLGRSSEIEVVYDSSIYGLRATRFALKKAPEGWKIDSQETLARTRESSLF